MFNFLYFPKRLAQLLCTGLIPAIDLGSDFGRYCRQVLVIAVDDDTQVNNFSCEWNVRTELAESLGLIPYAESETVALCLGKVVGVLEVIRCPRLANKTPWTFGNRNPETVYRIVSASLLDQPLDLDRLHHFEMHTYQCVMPYAARCSLFLPLSEHRFSNCYECNTLSLPLDDVLRDLLFFKDQPLRYKYVTGFNNNRYRTFKFDAGNEVYDLQNGDGNDCTLFSIFRNHRIPVKYYIFHLRILPKNRFFLLYHSLVLDKFCLNYARYGKQMPYFR